MLPGFSESPRLSCFQISPKIMAWIEKDIIKRGDYLMIVVEDGIYLDLTFSLSEAAVLERLRPLALGWSVSRVSWSKGFLGIGDKLLIFGSSNNEVPYPILKKQIEDSLNSFWEISAATVRVYTSDRADTPIPATIAEEWTGTLQLIAVTVMVIAIVYGISKFKE